MFRTIFGGFLGFFCLSTAHAQAQEFAPYRVFQENAKPLLNELRVTLRGQGMGAEFDVQDCTRETTRKEWTCKPLSRTGTGTGPWTEGHLQRRYGDCLGNAKINAKVDGFNSLFVSAVSIGTGAGTANPGTLVGTACVARFMDAEKLFFKVFDSMREARKEAKQSLKAAATMKIVFGDTDLNQEKDSCSVYKIKGDFERFKSELKAGISGCQHLRKPPEQEKKEEDDWNGILHSGDESKE